MLRRNAEWKLAALVIAFLLWAYITVAQQTSERAFRVAIALPEAPAGLAVLTPSKGELQATVLLRGDRELLEMATGQVQASAKLTSRRPGQIEAPITATFPRGLSQIRVTPQAITLRLERVIRRSVRVECQLTGDPSPGYVLGKPQVSPRSAIVSGAESAVSRVEQVGVRIDTSYAMLGQPQSGLLMAQDLYGREVAGVRVNPATAIVTIPVQHTVASRLLPVFVDLSGSPREGYQAAVSVDPPLVTAAGEAEKVKALASVSTLPLSLRGVSSSFRRRVELVVPSGVASLSATSVLVTVSVSPVPERDTPEE